MSQHYSDPTRESDPHALPDVETFQATYAYCRECDGLLISDTQCVQLACPECERQPITRKHDVGWFWQACFPDCLPDSEPIGPFDSQADAIAAAQSDCE